MLKCSECYIEEKQIYTKIIIVGELKVHGDWYGQRGVLCECQFRVFSSLIV